MFHTMSQKSKLVWMFLPLGLFFVGLWVFVHDVNSATIHRDDCTILALGKEADALNTDKKPLYTNSGNPLHTIALHCAGLGDVKLNDFDAFVAPLSKGDKVLLSKKEFNYLPRRWQLEIDTKTAAQ